MFEAGIEATAWARTSTLRLRLVFHNWPLFDALTGRGGILSEFLDETYPSKTRGMRLLYSENCTILTSTVFDRSIRVTDGQTNGRAIAYSALSMLSHAKNATYYTNIKEISDQQILPDPSNDNLT